MKLSLFWAATIYTAAVSASINPLKPAVISATPTSGTGMRQIFTLVYAHPNGASYIANAALLMNDTVDGRHSCWMTYEPATNRLWLVADDQLNWKFGLLGSANGINNPQCAVDLAASTVRHDGTNLTLNLVLTFSSAFSGTKNLYMRAVDKAGAATDYTAAGTWTVGAPLATAPSITVAPSSGSGMNQTFSFSYTNGIGSAQMTWLTVRIPTSSSSRTCWAAYDVANRLLSLASDDTTTWSQVAIGQAGQLSNSQCSLDPQHTTVTANGTEVTLQMPITFQAAFSGFKTLYVSAFLNNGSASPLMTTGAWDVFSPVTMQAFATATTRATDTGTHWTSMDEYQTVGSLGHQFAIVTVNPSDQQGLTKMLHNATAAHLQLIIGAYPPPYTLNADGSWNISTAGVSFIKQLAAHSSVVRAIFAFNEPYWTDPATGLTNSCGAVSAQQLRNLRNQIRSVWPQAKIYQDIGDPQSWAPGGGSWQSCVGNKFSDQSGIADYVGIWQYPFSNGGYYRQSMLDFAYNASRYVTQSMSAKPVFLNQSFACSAAVCGQTYSVPTPDQMKDINCSVRSVLPSGSSVSWYVWRQSLYSDFLSNHNELWSSTTPETCSAK